MKHKKPVHLICNAHLDPVWLWRWEEGCAEALSTFRTASDLIDEFPGFVFNHNESILYRWVEQYDPELFKKIQKHVADGRWHIMGGWYLQPDCNMPSGESFCRNILYGRKYFTEKFSKRPTTAINFDSFGHSRGLVQILEKSGFDSYLVCRSGGRNFPFKEQDFFWEGFDGSKVKVHRSDENYNSIFGKAAAELEKFLERKSDEESTLFLWGIGDHGGGPSREDLQNFLEFERNRDDLKIIHSTPEDYFAELDESKLQTYKGGLNPVAVGCYSDQVRIKQKHRQLENELYSGEKMASAAALHCNAAYPALTFSDASEDLIFSEFHDALPGSGTAPVEEDTLRTLDHGLEITSRERMGAFLHLTAGQKPVKDGTSVIMFYNPHPYPVTGVFECEAGLPKQNWNKDFLYPEVHFNGKRIPTQAEKECSNFGIDWRKKIVVEATLEASTMSRMDVSFKSIDTRPIFDPIVGKEHFIFDNGVMQVKINTTTGLIDEYSVNGIPYLKENSCNLVAHDDNFNPWGFGSGTKGKRQFTLLTPHEGSAYSGLSEKVIPSVHIIEDGEVRTVVEAVFGMHDSYAYQRYLLPKSGTCFDIETGVHWLEKEMHLKLELNTAENGGEFIGQVPFGREKLSTGDEAVFQKWVAVQPKNKSCGNGTLAVITAGTHAAGYKENLLGMTLLRSPAYTAANDNLRSMQEERYAPRIDQGDRTFHFRITAGETAPLLHELDYLAQIYNEKPYAMAYCPSGKGEKPKKLIEMDNTAIILSAFKEAEDKNGYILRFYESEGKPQSVKIKLPFADIEEDISFNSFEVKTYRYTKGSKNITIEELLEGY